MSIQRNDLMHAILYAYKNELFDTYNELLDVYYKLLEQEDINDQYIGEFTTYNIISDNAQNLLSTATK